MERHQHQCRLAEVAQVLSGLCRCRISANIVARRCLLAQELDGKVLEQAHRLPHLRHAVPELHPNPRPLTYGHQLELVLAE